LTSSLTRILVVSGPTGIGKSELAVAIARELSAEIINYDSIQVYRGFDIGSAKPSMDLRTTVSHHLLDIVEADEPFDAAAYAAAAEKVIASLSDRGRLPLLVGGTGFYLRSLLAGLPPMPGSDATIRQRLQRIREKKNGPERLHGVLRRVDPVSAARIALGDRHRLERALEVYVATGRAISSWNSPTAASPARYAACRIALQLPRPTLVERLDRRVEAMYHAGLLEETVSLAARYPRSARPFTAIGYAECLRVLDGRISLPQAIEETKRRTRGYAKRQMTWLRSEQGLHWIDMSAGLVQAGAEILRFWRPGC